MLTLQSFSQKITGIKFQHQGYWIMIGGKYISICFRQTSFLVIYLWFWHILVNYSFDLKVANGIFITQYCSVYKIWMFCDICSMFWICHKIMFLWFDFLNSKFAFTLFFSALIFSIFRSEQSWSAKIWQSLLLLQLARHWLQTEARTLELVQCKKLLQELIINQLILIINY